MLYNKYKNKEDIHIDLKNDMLTISAAHNEETSDKKKKQNYVRKERRYASYSRSFHVDGLEPSDIDASCAYLMHNLFHYAPAPVVSALL